MTPWADTVGEECFFARRVLSLGAQSFFLQACSSEESNAFASWEENAKNLSAIPVASEEEKELVAFLKRRWLSKACGYSQTAVHWACPCFDFDVQMHPDSTRSYSRDQGSQISKAYEKRLKEVRQELALSDENSLILTRPSVVKNYLPRCIEIDAMKKAESTSLERGTAVLDFTSMLRDEPADAWEKKYRTLLPAHLKGAVCIQEGDDGDWIRILSLENEKPHDAYRFILEWVSLFGFTANAVEVNRHGDSLVDAYTAEAVSDFSEKEAFIRFLNAFSWSPKGEHEALMGDGYLAVLKGLFQESSEQQWRAVMRSEAKQDIMRLCFSRIQKVLGKVALGDFPRFYDLTASLEQVHENLSSLLELLSPFKPKDFSAIYQAVLDPLPVGLKARSAVHSSGMTSLAGILKAVENSVGGRPRILYGENLYFEGLEAIEKVAHSVAMSNATEEDWREADLLLSQSNPAWKRGEPSCPNLYREERIIDDVRRALQLRSKPLSVALDCTIEWIDCAKGKKIIEAFDEEIASGKLNILCYRSGLKFDLFGMDNFCGAPFFMIHNEEGHWSAFEPLLTDPALQTDRLSFNWYCLAYRYGADHLERYRKQIFGNTRAILTSIPQRLFDPASRYRVIPMEASATPCFIDIKVSGALHELRASTAIGAGLYLQAMAAGHPVLYRRSIGFCHTNLGLLFNEDSSSSRLTVGLDPSQVEFYVDYFRQLDRLNGSVLQ